MGTWYPAMNQLPSTRRSFPVQLPSYEMPPIPAASASLSEVAPLHSIWDTLVAQRKWILLAGLAASVLAALFAFSLPSTYRATVSLLVESGRAKILAIEDLRQGGDPREHFSAQVEIVQSRDIAIRTVRAIELWNQKEFDARQRGFGLSTLIGLGSAGSSDAALSTDQLADVATERLMEKLKVEALRVSGVIKIAVETHDASLSAKIVNTLAKEYERADSESRLGQARSVSAMLQERATGLRQALNNSEAELIRFRESTGLLRLNGPNVSSEPTQNISGVTERLLTAKSRRAELEGVYQRIRKSPLSDFSDLPQVRRDLAVVEARARVGLAANKAAELSQRYGSEYTTVKDAQAQLKEAQDALAVQQRAVVKSIVSDYESAQATERELERMLDKAKIDLRGVNRNETRLAVLEREVESNRQLYDMFLKRAKETDVAAEVHSAVARVIDPAVPAARASGPKRLQIILLAFILASSLVAFFMLIRQALDRTLGGTDATEQKLKMPVMAELPAVGRIRTERMARFYLDLPKSDFAEGIRTIRTALQVSAPDENSRVVVLVTSALASEGKTVVATNLALASAMTRRTLLIDANMRRPRVGRLLGLASDAKGLTNLVAGHVGPTECIHRVGQSKLRVLPMGDMPVNALEVLLSRRFAHLMKALSERFEVIIIDSPAIDRISDSLALSSLVSHTLIVARSGETPYRLVQKCIDRLQRNGTDVLGVVLNHAFPARRHKDDIEDQAYEQHHPLLEAHTLLRHEPEAVQPAP